MQAEAETHSPKHARSEATADAKSEPEAAPTPKRLKPGNGPIDATGKVVWIVLAEDVEGSTMHIIPLRLFGTVLPELTAFRELVAESPDTRTRKLLDDSPNVETMWKFVEQLRTLPEVMELMPCQANRVNLPECVFWSRCYE